MHRVQAAQVYGSVAAVGLPALAYYTLSIFPRRKRASENGGVAVLVSATFTHQIFPARQEGAVYQVRNDCIPLDVWLHVNPARTVPQGFGAHYVLIGLFRRRPRCSWLELFTASGLAQCNKRFMFSPPTVYTYRHGNKSRAKYLLFSHLFCVHCSTAHKMSYEILLYIPQTLRICCTHIPGDFVGGSRA